MKLNQRLFKYLFILKSLYRNFNCNTVKTVLYCERPLYNNLLFNLPLGFEFIICRL
jgi:hypothetical protein